MSFITYYNRYVTYNVLLYFNCERNNISFEIKRLRITKSVYIVRRTLRVISIIIL